MDDKKDLVVRKIRTYFRWSLIATVACSSLNFVASGQGIFDGLPYSEQEIRDKINQYTQSFSSNQISPYIPINVYYRQIFLSMLSNPSLLNKLTAVDADIIKSLPAHDDDMFVAKDRAELHAICGSASQAQTITPQNAAHIIQMADAFDDSKARRDRDLDFHYGEVLNTLSAQTRDYVLSEMSAFSRHVTYSSFALGELARDVPVIAGVILLSGCENFIDQQGSYSAQTVFLRDQVASQDVTGTAP